MSRYVLLALFLAGSAASLHADPLKSHGSVPASTWRDDRQAIVIPQGAARWQRIEGEPREYGVRRDASALIADLRAAHADRHRTRRPLSVQWALGSRDVQWEYASVSGARTSGVPFLATGYAEIEIRRRGTTAPEDATRVRLIGYAAFLGLGSDLSEEEDRQRFRNGPEAPVHILTIDGPDWLSEEDLRSILSRLLSPNYEVIPLGGTESLAKKSAVNLFGV